MNATSVFAITVVTFAAALTAHIAIVIGLLRRAPRWRALLGIALPPLGVWWSWQQHRRVRAALFTVAAIGYGVARVLQ